MVKFKVVPRKNLQNIQEAPKYYPIAASAKKVSIRELVRRVAEMSTISTADTMAVIKALLTIMPEYLTEGRIVKLGEFGTFRLILKGEPSDTADDVNASKIKGVKLGFIPGKELKKALNGVTFTKE